MVHNAFGVVVIIFFSALHTVTWACDYSKYFSNDPVIPPDGNCSGPMDRALNMYHARQATACGAAKVEWYRDNQLNGTAQCGECVPGTSWIEDHSCAINQFCDDEGRYQDTLCLGVKPSYHHHCGDKLVPFTNLVTPHWAFVALDFAASFTFAMNVNLAK
eukprot:TRINITY_DN58479_c0_g1_i1.p1 TRINITY_DN58479_c0_g1~~TRINITY_DN58479_c0_g1_i1.p1  ORF type:complete len:168 (-),score=24.34 TRINITY_DN58479_c0_g1_i1:191-670(-)